MRRILIVLSTLGMMIISITAYDVIISRNGEKGVDLACAQGACIPPPSSEFTGLVRTWYNLATNTRRRCNLYQCDATAPGMCAPNRLPWAEPVPDCEAGYMLIPLGLDDSPGRGASCPRSYFTCWKK